jgi:hypothetical protein
MEEIQVKTYYPDIYGGIMTICPFANLINNESVILYSQDNKESVVIYQSEYNSIAGFYINTRELLISLVYNAVAKSLKQLNLPTNYTLIKAKPNYSNIYVSTADNIGFDVSLMGEGKNLEWEIEQGAYPKVIKPNVIELSGSEK